MHKKTVRSDVCNLITVTSLLVVIACVRVRSRSIAAVLPARPPVCMSEIDQGCNSPFMTSVSQPAQTSSRPLRLSCHCYFVLLDFRPLSLGNCQSILTIRGTYTNNERPLIRLARVGEMERGVPPRRGSPGQVPASWRRSMASALGQSSAAMRWHRTHGRGTAPSCWMDLDPDRWRQFQSQSQSQLTPISQHHPASSYSVGKRLSLA